MVAEVASALRAEARATNERRLLVLAGSRDACYDAAGRAVEAADLPPDAVTLLSEREALPCERLAPRRSGDLLGRTRAGVVVDCHDACRPNALGRAVGAVDGGGLLVLLTPPLAAWPDRRDGFDEGLAVPPFEVDDVAGNFRTRLVETLRAHRGVAIVDADTGDRLQSGLIGDRRPRRACGTPDPPDEFGFPAATYAACLTDDQVAAVHAMETLREAGRAVVVEADRGRGKSSAAGLAAGALAADGRDVLVTAPQYRSAREVFLRARALLSDLGGLADAEGETNPRVLSSAAGGSVRYADPPDAADAVEEVDAVFVDEAAALPVRLLERFLDARAVAFTTTVHGYEGAGRGFSVRFRDRLEESDLGVTEVRMDDPIRYAPGDPVEVWAFRALLLDARPPVDQLVADATPETVAYERLAPGDLLADEHLLREVFGLLVLAHYRTEPNDLARLLDAPNVTVRALSHDGHVVGVALLAREGGLPAALRAEMYEGSRVRGNMLPDVLTSQLRDESAGEAVGQRVLRIATHHAVRSRGLGSRLLAEIEGEFDGMDWLGVGYGATPELLAFWADNGYSTVHLSTTRNDTSGEYSALMLAPRSDRGRALHDRHAGEFARRIESVLAGPLDDVDPDVARAALRACETAVATDLTDREWRTLVGSAYGPGIYDTNPRPFRELAVKHLVDPADADLLSAREERLLVRKVLQCWSWDAVTADLSYHSSSTCMRALGAAYRPLVDRYAPTDALAERERY
ncbi:MAG: tRNA(Met) cytidine acetyltransferase TmcA [Halorientalis sp.]